MEAEADEEERVVEAEADGRSVEKGEVKERSGEEAEVEVGRWWRTGNRIWMRERRGEGPESTGRRTGKTL